MATSNSTTKVRNDINPLDWWKDNEKDFPSIIIVGKKIFLHSCYLNSIRMVVQYVGNCITSKRSNLKPDRVGK